MLKTATKTIFSLCCMLAFISLVSLPVTSVKAAELTAQEIVNKSSKLNDLPHEAELMKMTIIDSGGYKTIRSLRLYNRRFDDGLYRYLVVFDSPKGIRGTALLTWQNRKDSDDQWLYLPGVGKPKRIARSEKGNYFMGTDYTYEDLSSKTPDKGRYTKLTDSTLDGSPVYVIKDQMAGSKASLNEAAYKILYINKSNFAVMQTDFYNQKGKLLKRQTLSDFKKVPGTTAWRPSKIVMQNHTEKSQTIMEVMKRNFSSKAAPASYFTTRFISSKQHM